MLCPSGRFLFMRLAQARVVARGHGLEGQAKEGPKARLEGGPRFSKANTSPRGYPQLHLRCIALFFEPEFKVRRADQAKTQKVATVEILELAVVGSIHGRDDPTEAQAGPMVAGEHANLKPVGDELDPVGRHLPLVKVSVRFSQDQTV